MSYLLTYLLTIDGRNWWRRAEAYPYFVWETVPIINYSLWKEVPSAPNVFVESRLVQFKRVAPRTGVSGGWSSRHLASSAPTKSPPAKSPPNRLAPSCYKVAPWQCRPQTMSPPSKAIILLLPKEFLTILWGRLYWGRHCLGATLPGGDFVGGELVRWRDDQHSSMSV